VTAAAFVIETRRLGIARRILSTPTSAGTLIAGQLLGRLAVALVQAMIIVLGSMIFFGVNWGDPLGTAAAVSSFCLVGTGVAVLVGSLCSNEHQAQPIGFLLGLGLAALGGSMAPLEISKTLPRKRFPRLLYGGRNLLARGLQGASCIRIFPEGRGLAVAHTPKVQALGVDGSPGTLSAETDRNDDRVTRLDELLGLDPQLLPELAERAEKAAHAVVAVVIATPGDRIWPLPFDVLVKGCHYGRNILARESVVSAAQGLNVVARHEHLLNCLPTGRDRPYSNPTPARKTSEQLRAAPALRRPARLLQQLVEHRLVGTSRRDDAPAARDRCPLTIPEDRLLALWVSRPGACPLLTASARPRGHACVRPKLSRTWRLSGHRASPPTVRLNPGVWGRFRLGDADTLALEARRPPG
jgi:ABC-2 family transporter protein